MSAAASPAHHTKRICDFFRSEGLITADQHHAVTQHVLRTGARVEEVLLELSILSEATLLKTLAGFYKTRFVSTEKLAKADIDRATLQLIPRRFAETLGVLPILFDPKAHTLSVVTADADDLKLLGEVQIASSARDVRAFVARPAAVKAAIAKAYSGDLHAFALIERQSFAHSGLNTYDRNVLTDSVLNQALTVFPPERPTASVIAPPPGIPGPAQAMAPGALTPMRMSVAAAFAPGSAHPGGGSVASASILAGPPTAFPPVAGATLAPIGGSAMLPLGRGPMVTLAPLAATASALPALAGPPAGALSFGANDVLDLLGVMTGLLDNARAELRGHSSHVARLMWRVAERLGMPSESAFACAASGYVHDLGKMGPFHLTAINCSEYDGHRAAAQKSFAAPGRVLESVKLPAEVVAAAAHMYERYDGKGFPQGLAGKDVPLAARMLAIVDTYADLTENPRNPFRKPLQAAEACAVVAKYRGTIFDPQLVDLIKQIILGEPLRTRLLASRYVVLVLDADPDDTGPLEARLAEQGFGVRPARTAEQALKLLAEGDVDVVVSELDVAGTDGLAVLAEARRHAWGKDVPWVVHTRRQGQGEAQRAFERGAVDFVSKPSSADVLAAKLRAMLEQRAAPRSNRGVSGSIREMGLADVVKVLWQGRRTGNVRIRSRAEMGEIHLVDGAVVNAAWGELRGEEAFFALLKLTEGELALDPSFRPPNRPIATPTEMLLLEGMRRLDDEQGG